MHTVRKHKRVYEMAKQLRVSSEVLMGILPTLEIEVKLSVLEQGMGAEI